MAMLFNIARAEVYLNGPGANVGANTPLQQSPSQLSSIPIILSWASALLSLVGVLLLIIAFFLYVVGSGDESKMAKSHNVLIGGIACLVGAFVCYLITSYFS